ncbi:MAG: histidine phosphatase family protein [Burkholderiaceae bacterium]|nr:histidine phosphatase family protein [Burkholderiaceae bacterium]
MAELWIWRHPRPDGAAGRCIGAGSDLPVDPRRAKRQAHRIRRQARRAGLPRVVATSPLRRCADVGRWLRRWGWRHVVDARLAELDFGRWDGRPWSEISREDFAAWEADFLGHAPGGGESLAALRLRQANWLAERDGATVRLVVGHAGWINALRTRHHPTLTPTDWPRPLRYAQGWRERLDLPEST